jgi:hypothetical protein
MSTPVFSSPIHVTKCSGRESKDSPIPHSRSLHTQSLTPESLSSTLTSLRLLPTAQLGIQQSPSARSMMNQKPQLVKPRSADCGTVEARSLWKQGLAYDYNDRSPLRLQPMVGDDYAFDSNTASHDGHLLLRSSSSPTVLTETQRQRWEASV